MTPEMDATKYRFTRTNRISVNYHLVLSNHACVAGDSWRYVRLGHSLLLATYTADVLRITITGGANRSRCSGTLHQVGLPRGLSMPGLRYDETLP